MQKFLKKLQELRLKMKIKRLCRPEDFTMNQLYMFMDYNTLRRGYCIEITNDYVRFTYDDKFYKKRYNELLSTRSAYFAEYNSNIFKKFQDLKKYHEQEINDLLEANIYKRKEEKNSNLTGTEKYEIIIILSGFTVLLLICILTILI